MDRDADIVILGAGLAGGLIALALARARPELRVVLIEAGARAGGNHVWSFFAADLPPGGDTLVAPMLAARWDEGYDVRFPGMARTLPGAYRSITGERLAARLDAVLPAGSVITGMAAEPEGPDAARLADGRLLRCGAVIDARGAASLPHLSGGWQKFAGQMLRTPGPHGLTRPVVMDATVDQVDGYRFVYCLPFAEDRVFVEDTYYSDGPELDLPALRRRIAAYAQAQAWAGATVEHEESGVLPVVGRGDWPAFRAAQEAAGPDRAAGDGASGDGAAGDGAAGAGAGAAAVLAGLRGGLFHPLTSYSLPTALAFALDLSGQADLSATGLSRWSRAWADAHWRRSSFYRMLVTMLFGAAAPAERWRVLSRFYRLDAQLVERFYAGRSTMADKARILTGKPPVPLGAAVRALAGFAPLSALETASPENAR